MQENIEANRGVLFEEYDEAKYKCIFCKKILSRHLIQIHVESHVNTIDTFKLNLSQNPQNNILNFPCNHREISLCQRNFERECMMKSQASNGINNSGSMFARPLKRVNPILFCIRKSQKVKMHIKKLYKLHKRLTMLQHLRAFRRLRKIN